MQPFDIDTLLRTVFRDDAQGPNVRQIFDEKLEAYGIAKSKALELLGIDKNVLEDILSGQARQPNLIHVLKLAEFLEIGLHDLVGAVMKGQSVETIASLDRARKATFLLKNFDLKRLAALGFLEKGADMSAITDRLLTFFGYESISAFEEGLELPLFSRTKRAFTDKMMKFWITAAYRVFQDINNPNEYDREGVKDVIASAKPYCKDTVNGLLSVCKALYHNGVTVITQAHLPTTQVRGGTFIINGNPCIVLTDLGKNYPTVWTTLLHELHHVIFDLSKIEKAGYHLTDPAQPDLLLIEDKANEFMMEYFCGLAHFQYIKPHIHNAFVVSKFAKEIKVHPSLVYNSYQFFQQSLYKQNYWGAFKSEIPKSAEALKSLNPVTWKEKSIKEIAQSLKTLFEINT